MFYVHINSVISIKYDGTRKPTLNTSRESGYISPTDQKHASGGQMT